MILTINYSDLQDVKRKIIDEKITNNDKIYVFIESYKETLNYMYKNGLVQEKSKKDLEDELVDFATQILKNTKKSYSQISKEYTRKTAKDYYIDGTGIQLKL